jgi:hypothetical protein
VAGSPGCGIENPVQLLCRQNAEANPGAHKINAVTDRANNVESQIHASKLTRMASNWTM